MKTKLLLLVLLCFSLDTNAAIRFANFTASTVSGCVPLNVTFTDLSAGNLISWNYDFGDGGSSYLTNPKYTFTRSGVFKVKLTVTDSFGSSDFTVIINVKKLPQPDFSTAKTQYCPNEPILFSNKTLEGDTFIKTSTWDLGDGNIMSSKTDINKSYVISGTFTVKLTVRDYNNCQNTVTKNQYMTIYQGPKADFTITNKYTCSPPLKVNFTNKSSSNSVSYVWDVGDGNSYTDPNPVIFYSTANTYNISLTATTVDGCKHTVTKPLQVNFGKLKADFITASMYGCIPFDPKFQNNSQPTGTGLSVDYYWDFGDGSRSTFENPGKVFNKTGVYNVKLRITGIGCADSIVKTITVSDKPKPVLSLTDSIGCGGMLKTTFRASGTNLAKWTWFIDGKNIDTKVDSLPYTFKRSGIYNVYVLVTDIAGCDQYVQFPRVVVQNLLVGFRTDPGGCVPYTPEIIDTSSTKLSSKMSYMWEDGAGNTYNVNQPPVTYTKEGEFNLRLVVTDGFGCSDESSSPVKVGHKIKPSFIMDKRHICNNEDIKFYNTTPLPGRKQANSWKWEFGVNSGTKEDSFFTKLRDYPRTLTPRLISENNECRDTLEKIDSVHLEPPLADFIPYFDTCYSNVARIKNTSIVATSGMWVLPNGKTSTDSQVYVKINPFKAEKYKLIVFNAANGCSDTVIQEVTVPMNVSNILVESLTTCTPQRFKLSNYQRSALRSHWDFGNGDTSAMNPMGKDSFSYAFKEPGTYTITHTGWDMRSCAYTSSSKVTVKGPFVKSKVWPLKGCLPLKIYLQDSVSETRVKRKYWRIQDHPDSIRASNKDSIVEFTIKSMPANGDTVIHVELFVEDVDGCTSSKVYNIRPSGPKATIMVHKFIKCDAMNLDFEAIIDSVATYMPVSLEWKMGDGNILTDSKFDYIYEKNGFYFVNVKLTDGLGCTYTDQIDVSVSQPELLAKFDIDNRHSVCPPLIAQFTEKSIFNNSIPITDYFWDFGDGTTSSERNPGKIYHLAGNYTVTLTVKNKFGCTNTRVLKNAIQVGGPIAEYKISEMTGCEGLTVTFETTSGTVSYAEWDFGNGASSANKKTSYTYWNEGKYFPKVLLKDSGGCQVIAVPKDSIMVLRRPSADFTINTHCLDDSILFADASLSNIKTDPLYKSKWKIGDDIYGSKDVHAKFRHIGMIPVSLVVENANACTDTASAEWLVSKPSAGFESKKNKLCLGDTVQLEDKSTSSLGAYSHTWLMDGTPFNLPGFYPGSGDHKIELIIADQLNCLDTSTLAEILHVADTAGLAPIDILSVSMDAQKLVKVIIKPTTDKDFTHYTLYHFENGNWAEFSSISRADSIVSHHQYTGPLSSQCYKATQSNYCGAETNIAQSREHCTIHTLAAPGQNSVIVSWNPYTGWPVEEYEVLREDPNGPGNFNAIGKVDGTTMSYSDTSVNCKTLHAYKILAHGDNTGEDSYSDTAKAEAIWLNRIPAPLILYATVNEDTSVIVQWELNQEYKRSIYKSVLLYKYAPANDNSRNMGLLVSSLNDRAVNVDKYSYHYFTRVTDLCGDTSRMSNEASSICLLTSTNGTFNRPSFVWNKYRQWPAGVDHYEVQRMDGNQFVVVANTNDTFFTDDQVPMICRDHYVYRVLAYSKAGGPLNQPVFISLSNEVKVKPKSSLFVPNAFTPNHDGLNEVFAPKGQYIYNYHLEIYNRWGEKMYSTEECLGGWDGFYKDQKAEQGLYYYKVTALGNDGATYSFVGTIALLQ